MPAWTATRDSAVVWSYYPLDETTVDRILAAVRTEDTARQAPDVPWAAALERPDGSVIAAVSPLFASGLFWTRSDTGLTIGDHIADVVADATDPALDPAYVISFLLLDADPRATAFKGVHRIPSGITTVFHDARITSHDWLSPDSTTLTADPVAQYRDTFDRALSELTPADGPLVATMSAGLDSTMIVASLATLTDRPVIALCHSPVPEAQLQPSQGWEPDDYPLALAMQDAFAGQVHVERITAAPTDHPLDAARAAARDQWLPVLNPDNQIWLHEMSTIAQENGADRLFAGMFGNASFSNDHAYAVSHHLQRGQLQQARHALTRGTRRLTPRMLAGAVRSAARTSSRTMPDPEYRRIMGLGTLPSTRRIRNDRAGFLDFLRPGDAPYANLTPAAWPAPLVDPFRSSVLIDLAAAIPPARWRHLAPRGFAREVGSGRVPDSIRLRTSRGGQSHDVWYLIRNTRDRYLDEVDALTSTPVLDRIVDVDTVRDTVAAWPWGEVSGPPRIQIVAINRLLTMSTFVQQSARRLRDGDRTRYSYPARFTRSINRASHSADAT